MDFADVIPMVEEQATRLATHSWEYGVLVESLLELHYQEASVYRDNPFPQGWVPHLEVDGNRALALAKQHIILDRPNLCEGNGKLTLTLRKAGQRLTAIGSAADPASLGVAAILLGQHDDRYMTAAKRQLQTLLEDTPRMSNNAISHRETVAEAWSDSLYMVPPFLAYCGVATRDLGCLKSAVEQCQLYHDILCDSSTGLWRHIEGPEKEDKGYWSTGVGWTAAGMCRVLAVLVNCRIMHFNTAAEAEQLQRQMLRLIRELFDGLMCQAREGDLVRNYIDDESWFGECAGTAALVSAIYRLGVMFPNETEKDWLDWAEESYESVISCIDQDTGLVSPVVNPLTADDRSPRNDSAEAQAFVLLMYAARRDFDDVKTRSTKDEE